MALQQRWLAWTPETALPSPLSVFHCLMKSEKGVARRAQCRLQRCHGPWLRCQRRLRACKPTQPRLPPFFVSLLIVLKGMSLKPPEVARGSPRQPTALLHPGTYSALNWPPPASSGLHRPQLASTGLHRPPPAGLRRPQLASTGLHRPPPAQRPPPASQRRAWSFPFHFDTFFQISMMDDKG